jgi:hypothetical protein
MGKDNERKLVDKTKKDTVSKSFWRDNEHFADLFNAVLFGGEQVVKPDNLEEMDTDGLLWRMIISCLLEDSGMLLRRILMEWN